MKTPTIIILTLITLTLSAQNTTPTFTPITSENIHQLELGYALPGSCKEFSPDGTKMLIFDDGSNDYLYDVYDIASGAYITSMPGSFALYDRPYLLNPDGTFKGLDNNNADLILDLLGSRFAETSPDETLVAKDGDGVYDIMSGERLFEIHGYATFHPSGRWLISSGNTTAGDGVYDVTTGKKLFHATGSLRLNPDGSLLSAEHDGVYDLESGELIITFDSMNVRFSPSGNYLTTADAWRQNGETIVDGTIYDITTREILFTFDGFPRFNLDETLLIANGDAVYEVPSGNKLLELSGEAKFSPDSSQIVVAQDGVYDLASGHKILIFHSRYTHEHTNQIVNLEITEYYLYSPNGRYLAVKDYGAWTRLGTSNSKYYYHYVYDMETLEPILHVPGRDIQFAADGTLFASSYDGVYDLATGEKIIALKGKYNFILDDTILIEHDSNYATNRSYHRKNFYDVSTGEIVFELPLSTNRYEILISPNEDIIAVDSYGLCVLYGIAGTPWPYRSGLVQTIPEFINIRAEPTAGSEITGTLNGAIYVIGQSADGSQYKVGTGWIWSDYVEPLYLPDNLSIIDTR